MRFRTLNLSLASGFLLVCCTGNNPSGNLQPTNTRPGMFAMSQMNGLSKKASELQNNIIQSQIDLDSIRNSRSFYFLLRNVGDISITDITIGVTGKSFSISPNNIQELQSENLLQRETNLLPIIRLDVIHGNVINGTGWGSLLQPGDNLCTLTVAGVTKNGSGADTAISMTNVLKVFAYIADMKAYSDGVELNLDLAHAGIMTADRQQWGPRFTGDTLYLHNTGNVKLTIDIDTLVSSYVLVPNDSLALYQRNDYTVTIWPSNTISDVHTLLQLEDGRIVKMFTK